MLHFVKSLLGLKYYINAVLMLSKELSDRGQELPIRQPTAFELLGSWVFPAALGAEAP